MDINNITAVYFVGAGGIGMSALIRYFLSKGKKVGGYDKTPSGLTEQLNYEGAAIHYEDNVDLIPDDFTDPVKTLVVYTPAVPEDHSELCYFRGNGFEVMKRARVLGEITGCNRGLCVAGTHGKTTTSSMVAHLLKQSHVDCNAFLGGILKNYDSNLMLSDKSDLTVIEADEFDRSFHWLKPYMAVITAADPDHLDIYGTPEAYRESFEHFTSLIRPDGCLLMKQGINVTPRLQEGVKFYTYTGALDAKELSTLNWKSRLLCGERPHRRWRNFLRLCRSRCPHPRYTVGRARESECRERSCRYRPCLAERCDTGGDQAWYGDLCRSAPSFRLPSQERKYRPDRRLCPSSCRAEGKYPFREGAVCRTQGDRYLPAAPLHPYA